jgi:hypothetical protein
MCRYHKQIDRTIGDAHVQHCVDTDARQVIGQLQRLMARAARHNSTHTRKQASKLTNLVRSVERATHCSNSLSTAGTSACLPSETVE